MLDLAAYRDLVARMRDMVPHDGLFVENPEPVGPVDYVFICMEPSVRERSLDEARAHLAAGARNFAFDFVLHYPIREYLLAPGERYHITDISKGAMRVKDAPGDRRARWDEWYPLLLDELHLVARPEAHVFTVGRDVADYLAEKEFPWPRTRILHYSGIAARWRLVSIDGHQDEFQRFRDSLTLARVLEVMAEGASPYLQGEIEARRAKGGELTVSQCALIFGYKLAFERVRALRNLSRSAPTQ